jgi:tetratricopeptide (TPR) repeat protein
MEQDALLQENFNILEEELKIHAGSMNVMQALFVVYSKNRHYEKALIMLKRMEEVQPDNASIYYNIAFIKAKQNKVHEFYCIVKKRNRQRLQQSIFISN